MNEDNYQYSFVVGFDLNEKLFFLDNDTLLARFENGPVYAGNGVWKNLDEKTEGFYTTLNTVLHNSLQDGNTFILDAIEEALKENE